MKKGTIIGLVVLGLVVMFIMGSYNGLVSKEEVVDQSFANIQSQYQRRSDLIPNLVSTVKGYASHEEDVFTQVTEARAKVSQINVDASDMTPEKMEQYMAAQKQLSTGLGRLLAVAENYPELKANENFLQLQSQLEGTENRINYARDEYNGKIKEYNVTVRTFPNMIIATIFGFNTRESFEADAGAEVAPVVDFN